MNKKFSTLVAAALVISGFANAESWDAPKGATVATEVATGNYYHIGASDGTDNFYLTIKKNDDGAFQLYAKKLETDADKLAASTDSALWEPIAIKSQVPFPAAYTFKNKFTGKTLAVKYNTKDQENPANIIAGKFAAVLVDPSTEGAVSEFTWGYNTSDSVLVAYDAQNNPFILDISATAGVVNFVKGTSANMLKKGVKPFNPAEIYLSAKMLNEELNGSFKLNVLGTYTDNTEKPLIDEFVAHDAAAENDSEKYPGVFLQAKGEKRDRKDKGADGKYLKNENVFLMVDTVFVPGLGRVDSINAKGLRLALDTVVASHKVWAGDDYAAWIADSVAAGRNVGNYRFFFYKNIGKVDADSLIIKVDSIPSIEKANQTFAAGSQKASGAGYLANYVIGTGNTPVLTPLDSTYLVGQDTYQLPFITLGDGIKADLAEGIYSIQQKNGGFYQARLVYGDDFASMKAYDSLGVKACKEVPYTQWRFVGSKGRYNITNRENNAVFKAYQGAVKTLYKTNTADEYKYGDETLIIKKIEGVDEEDAFLGYKHFTKEELDNLAVRLRFTAFGGVENLYVIGSEKDSLLHVHQVADVEDAIEFKLKAVKNAKEEDKDVVYNAAEGLSRRAYQLMVNNHGDDSEQQYLVYDATVKAFALSDFKARGDGARADSAAVAVVFRQNCEGQYQILPVDTAMNATGYHTGFKADSLWVKGEQMTVIGSNDLLVGSSVNDLPTGYFVLDVPEAPKYATVNEGHYRVQSVNNTSLAITTNVDGTAVLRGEGESMLKSDPTFVAENFVLFIDSACTHDAARPAYYISTAQATIGELTEEEIEAGTRYYMMNALATDGKGNKDNLIFAKAYQLSEEIADTLIVGSKKMYVVDKKADGTQNRAAFAFQTTANAGEYKIQNIATGKYVKQVNTVITLAEGYANGNNFTLEAKSAPTANEGITTSEVVVIAGEGQLTIANAAGKKVVVTNILGQVVANTVLASDNAVIAAPQGVVVVAVEGEEAVKAIVK